MIEVNFIIFFFYFVVINNVFCEPTTSGPITTTTTHPGTCNVDGKIYQEGEIIGTLRPSTDGCRYLRCYDGEASEVFEDCYQPDFDYCIPIWSGKQCCPYYDCSKPNSNLRCRLVY
ncbi:CLUMA_CG008326, isoform A [Clunio marinus]|uniref:CLUMA_CG008326, isoform A n=1 Tax=Clunio marinus TaxID=568069 RepID=A0A1J1I3E5_9DIPT|nr:CLUMA_CG008326, isoform A [Clunio marinus]